MEPSMPIYPKFSSAFLNPCVETTQKTICLPYVHIISGWHMFSEESLGWLKHVKQLEVRGGGGCFDDWTGDSGRGWTQSWGGPPQSGAVIMTHCNKLLGWYPAFAGRYTSAWGNEYGPCKESQIAKDPHADYYAKYMWQVCRPRAIKAHDLAMGTGGSGKEATPPFVMKALYGPSRVKVISALRNPVDRLETSFWAHRHYPGKYGASPDGFHKYVVEQTSAFNKCVSKEGDLRRCAYLFELLGQEYSDVFFHCDQLIRGLYEPFIRDWHNAFGRGSLLVIRTEELLDEPLAARTKLLKFLNLPGSPTAEQLVASAPTTTSYAQLHKKSLEEAKAMPMLNKTRELAEAFYRPHNEQLGLMLEWTKAEAWPRSASVL